MAQDPTTPQQELIGTVLSPSLGTARAVIPIQLYEPCDLEYISVASIRALYPSMVRLEVDGQTITPRVGFQARERFLADKAEPQVPNAALNAEASSAQEACPSECSGMINNPSVKGGSNEEGVSSGSYTNVDPDEKHGSTEEIYLGDFLHALVNVDEGLTLEESSNQKEDLQEQHIENDVLLQHSSAQVYAMAQTTAAQHERGDNSEIIPPTGEVHDAKIVPCLTDDIEWIECQPGKIIHVVHDLAMLSSGGSPESEHQKIATISLSVATPGLAEQQQGPVHQSLASADAFNPISSSAIELPESYWLRFRQEMEDVVLRFLISKDPSAVPEDHHREAFEEAMALSINRQVERVTRRPAMPSPLSKTISKDPSTSPSSEDDPQDDDAAQCMSPESDRSSQSDCASSSSESQSSDDSTSGSASPVHNISDGSSSGSVSSEEDGSSRSPAQGSSNERHRELEDDHEPLTEKYPRVRTDAQEYEQEDKEEEEEEGELRFFGAPISSDTHAAPKAIRRSRSPLPLHDSYRPRELRKRQREDLDDYLDKSDRVFTPLKNRQRERDVLATNEPFEFSENGLARFIEDRNGTVHNIKTQAITVSLSSWPIAQKFYKFLCFKQYHGIWLDVSFRWYWGQRDMDEFVLAVESSKIQILFLNGQESQKRRITPSTRCDPLVRLLGHKSLKELHLVDMPDILRYSTASLPADLSHLQVLELSFKLVDRNSQQNGRFFELIKATTHLRHLQLEAPPADLPDHMKLIKRAIEASNPRRMPLAESKPSAKKPPSTVEVQFYHSGKSWVTLQIERASADIREFSLDLGDALCRSYSSSSRDGSILSIMNKWTCFFGSDLSHSLTALRIKNQLDDSWILPLLEWIKAHRRSKRTSLQELRVDCQSMSKPRFKDFCGLLDEAGSTATTLRLTHMTFLIRADWVLFFRSLNFAMLKVLHLEGANLGDREVRELVGCLKDVSRRDRSLKLTKLKLQKTIVSSVGWKDLQNECARNGWTFTVDST
ncbi:hypothetical protein BGZ72_009893 [Mortierella alpina]|nr:hypothetical protein BGZ72_009893 [Mortierella alpina]